MYIGQFYRNKSSENRIEKKHFFCGNPVVFFFAQTEMWFFLKWSCNAEETPKNIYSRHTDTTDIETQNLHDPFQFNLKHFTLHYQKKTSK